MGGLRLREALFRLAIVTDDLNRQLASQCPRARVVHNLPWNWHYYLPPAVRDDSALEIDACNRRRSLSFSQTFHTPLATPAPHRRRTPLSLRRTPTE